MMKSMIDYAVYAVPGNKISKECVVWCSVLLDSLESFPVDAHARFEESGYICFGALFGIQPYLSLVTGSNGEVRPSLLVSRAEV